MFEVDFCTFERSSFLIPLTSTNFGKRSQPVNILSNCMARHKKDITSTSLSDNKTSVCLHPERGWSEKAGVLASFLFQPFHSPRPSQDCHLLSWPESGQSDMTLLAYVPSGNSTWIRYRKEASRAIVWGLTQAVDWTVGLLLCWYCWSQAHRCGTAWTAEA